jgi:DNA-binding LytR/AlgR family response regulator
MKIRIEVDPSIIEEEVIIKCNELNDDVKEIQAELNELLADKSQIVFYRDDQEYYISLHDILFFETDSSGVTAHTVDNIYTVKYKLYELEKELPRSFARVSKSTIVNVKHIYSILRNLTSASIVEFRNTHKKIYVSRHYYKALKIKLLEKRR